MNKFHYISNMTGELCEGKREVISAMWWWLKHYSSLPVSRRKYIEYFFSWSYSKQGF